MNPGAVIQNEWQQGRGAAFKSTDPATGAVLWDGASADEEQIHAAVAAARGAFPSWSRMTPSQRYEYLLAFQAEAKAGQAKLAEAISRETGKPLWEAGTEAAAVVSKVDLTLEAYQTRCLEAQSDASGAAAALRYKPIGVAAVLGPFNLPIHLPNGHILPALLAGNAIVFKPSEQTPYVCELYMEFWRKAGLPGGVINAVQGGGEVGEALSEHDGIDALFFTGSYAVGSAIHRAFGGKPEKMLALEMGGNNPLIVHNPQDIDAAVYFAIQSAFITSGQRCVCARRVIVTDGPWRRPFIERFVEATGNIRYGAWTDDPEPFFGPVISAAQADKSLQQYQSLIDAGAEVILPLQRDQSIPALLSPSIVKIAPGVSVEDEEIFAPLTRLYEADSFDDAIEMANDTKYGLSAGLIGGTTDDYQVFRSCIRAGVVNWNRQITGANSRLPFGGVGRSGNYRPSGFFAVDYCAFPVASLEQETLAMPESLTPGVTI